ncbi:MAG TPA: radical SAM protein, partial [Candidatus Eremiobacteraeota bacterium]|nr:radical SAM protein [Candidatus Eremiobacteraeota bacterium]
PLSLLYVASGLTKNKFKVIIMDNRLYPDSWRQKLLDYLDNNTLFVGITVMSGSPIANAIEVSKLVKNTGPIPVVWGGAHPTVRPEQILIKNFVDFTISGSGVNSSIKLAESLSKSIINPEEFKDIAGLGYKHNGEIICNKIYKGFEHVPYTDMPYYLIEDFSKYRQIGSTERIFPIYSAYGCPYNCAFCVSPSLYRDFKYKWVPLPAKEIVDHIEYLKKNYGATEIYFYDDDSFVNLDHIHSIIKEVRNRTLKIKMSFRGARVNEVLKMDKEYLHELAEAGTHILHIGIESGSQRILDLFNKGIKVEDIFQMNRRLSENKKIISGYNWIIGTPTETLQNIKETTNVIIKLIDHNPRCIIFPPNKFRPLPGTDLFILAIQHGYKEPATLEEWIYEELEGDKSQVWYTSEIEKMIKMLQVTSYFIDNKQVLLLKKHSFKNMLIKLLFMLYRPVARFRFKYGITGALIEYPIFQFFVSRYRK